MNINHIITMLLLLLALSFSTSCQTVPATMAPSEAPTESVSMPSESVSEQDSVGFYYDNLDYSSIAMNYASSARALSLSGKRTVFPDTLDSFTNYMDYMNGSAFHVGTLNADFTIPEGYYVYQIPGQYWDFTENQAVTLEFVKEYVFTMKEVAAEDLVKDIRSLLQENNKDPEYRAPYYVVYSIRIFRKEYLPVENLFSSLLADSGEYYSSGAFYCSLGKKTWEKAGVYEGQEIHYYYANLHEGDGGELLDRYIQKRDKDESDREELLLNRSVIPEDVFPVDGWVDLLIKSTNQYGFMSESTDYFIEVGPFFYGADNLFRSGTASHFVETSEIGNGLFDRYYTIKCSNPSASVLSDTWWKRYQKTIQELSSEEGKRRYAYSNVQIRLTPGYLANYKSQYTNLKSEQELMDGWYCDSQKDVDLRAYVYANLRATYNVSIDEFGLQNIIILLKDLDDGNQLYIALLSDPFHHETRLTLLEKGWNALKEVDLGFAREYVSCYMR